jgi:hypothetical protein
MLTTDATLTAGRCAAMHPDDAGAAPKVLLPRLSKLVVVSEEDSSSESDTTTKSDPVQVHGPLLPFVHTYRLAGRDIYDQVISE